jgi:regulator of nonsense transcripts 3
LDVYSDLFSIRIMSGLPNGVLSAPPAILQKSAATTSAAAQSRPGEPASASTRRTPRLKVVIRHLPPGLSQTEFEAALGPEWKVGHGEVDWYNFRPGRISKELGEPSEPAVAYLHLTDEVHLSALAETVARTEFKDAKNTMNDATLIGPPCVEFAPHQKIPVHTRQRKDARRGTIDQDQYFIAFLEGLTNPIEKAPADLEPSAKEEVVKTTPLIEHLREKKAAKERPSSKAVIKDARAGAKDKKRTKEARKDVPTPATADKARRSSKLDRAAKEAVKVLNRNANAVAGASTEPVDKPTPSQPAPHRERPRAPFNIAAKIQRDLGIGPAAAARRPRAQRAPADAPAAPASALPSSTDNDGASQAQAATAGNKAESPRRNRKGSTPVAPKTIVAPKGPAQMKPPQAHSPAATPPAAPTKRAFLKHANPSQGITEPLLKAALEAFGAVEHVEIDKRKGVAFADFADVDGLAAAIRAAKVDVAEGAVDILEYRPRNTHQDARGAGTLPRGGRGGSLRHRGRGRGGPPSVAPASVVKEAPDPPGVKG